MALKDIILTSEENYETLVEGGSITKDGETFTYDEDSVYAVETQSLEIGDGLEVTNGKLKATVVDNVLSTSTTNALSANQGKILNDKIDTEIGNVDALLQMI